MIILFEENEKSFSTLGLGVLKDATSCIVKEKLNDEFTLTMEYPVKGSNFSKIKNNRIICVKPNPYSEPQAFRIFNVTKAINGRVIVDADHISYDTNSIPIKAFSATSLQDVLVQIQNGCVVDNPFTLSSDISRSKSYKTTAPYNLRAILMSDEESIVTEYDAELEFDNYVIKILAKRGKNRGAIVRYGHNMTDLNHSLSTDLLYNGVFPYYHTEKTSTETKTSDEFPQVYIVGSKTYQDGWLSYSKDGEPYHPMDESPVQIATEGEYYQKVFVWNTLYNVYQEKVYNEQVTIIQGLTEPSWLTIDWSKFPLIVIKAAQKGYYKKATDTDWGEIKGVGDVIYEGSITSSGLMENLILSFSEVIPSKSTSTNEEVTEVVDVQLDQPIMWIETHDAKAMLHDRILMLDLTSEFEEEPSQINLRAKAEEYINKHKIGTIKHSTTLSFVDLSATAEGSRFENLDHVELGDTVKVIYEDANIEVELRVITTEYDVLSGRYNSIELGEKKEKMSTSTIQNGDNVSALTNDVGYATVTTVNKLIANIITANYIEALNAKLSSAQISQLSVERINCTGIIEASQFTIDSLVAKLLIAENAEIADTLTAGNIKVAGDIAINSGQITITSDKGTKFIVDRDGNLTANSVSITGGNLNINDGVFEVTNDGVLTATAADITGTIRAKEGEIASFIIAERMIHYGEIGSNGSVIMSPGVEATISNLDSSSKTWAFTAGSNFGVTTSGVLYAKDVNLTGKITATSGYIANFRILEDRIATYSGDTTYNWSSTGNGIYLGSYGLKLGDGFKVSTDGNMILTKGSIEIQNGAYSLSTGAFDSSATYYEKDIWGDYNEVSLTAQTYQPNTYYLYDGTKAFFQVDSRGNVSANSIDITGGEITIGGSRYNPIFKVTQAGELSARSATISGSLNIKDGEIILGGNEYNYQYEAVTLSSSSYKKNVYYTKSGSNYYLSTGDYVSGTQYYKFKSGANFYVSDAGHMFCNSAEVQGKITSTEGEIGGFTLASNNLHNGTIGQDGSVLVSKGYTATISNLINTSKTWAFVAGDDFGVTTSGDLYAKSVHITGDDAVTTTGVEYNYSWYSHWGVTYYPHKMESVSSMRGTGIYVTKVEHDGNWGNTGPAHIPPIDSDYADATWSDRQVINDAMHIGPMGLYSENILLDYGSGSFNDTPYYYAKQTHFPMIFGYATNLIDRGYSSLGSNASLFRHVVSGMEVIHCSTNSVYVPTSGTSKRIIDIYSQTCIAERNSHAYNPNDKDGVGGASISLIYRGHGENTDMGYSMQTDQCSLVIANISGYAEYGLSAPYQISLHSDNGTVLYDYHNGSVVVRNFKTEGMFVHDYDCYYVREDKSAPVGSDWVQTQISVRKDIGLGCVHTKVMMRTIDSHRYLDIYNWDADQVIIGAVASIIVPKWTTQQYSYGYLDYRNGYVYEKVYLTSSTYTGYTYYVYNSSNDTFTYDSTNTYDSSKQYYSRSSYNPYQPVVQINDPYTSGSAQAAVRIHNPNSYPIVVMCVIYYAYKL